MKNIYRYIGDGMGVPGLPHELTDDDAKNLDVVELLNAAVDNGSYEIVPAAQDAPESKPKKIKEVNNGQ